MKKSTFLKVLFGIIAFVALGCLPAPVLAQRGGGGHGGGGGGGFHGGGGGSFHGGSVGGFHGGGAYSGYRGGGYYGGYRGGYYGGRGGYYGWGGRYWGYPRYGYGWGFGFGWPYWGWGYPYGGYYGYSPWGYSAYPYYYYQSCPPGYSCPDNGNDDPPPANSNPKSDDAPPQPGRPSSPGGTASMYDDTGSAVGPESESRILSVDRITATPSSYRVVRHPNTKPNIPASPQVQSAMRALREMPPFVREREIETGRYSHFSPQEKELLRSVD
jgi:hypothetical protein